MGNIYIKNARIWDGEKFLEGDILTEGKKIAAIKEKGKNWEGREKEQKADNADFCYDAAGRIVSAGLVDIHTHMRGISSDQYGFDPQMCCLPFGVTAAVDAGAEKGGKALMDNFLVKNLAFVAASFRHNHPELEVLEERIRLFGDRVAGIKAYFVEGFGVEDVSSLKELCEFAHAKKLRVMVHTTDSPIPMYQILETLSNGDIFSHAYHGGRYNVWDDKFASLAAARKRGVIIDAGMAGHVHTDFSVLKAAIQAGEIPDVISTDITQCSAYTRGGKYGMPMCMSMMREYGMKENDIMRAVTSHAAKAIGKEDEWGYLMPGRDADIAVLEEVQEEFDLTDKAGNRIYGYRSYRNILTILDGLIVYRR